MTPLLFHGPEARQRAVLQAMRAGRLLSDPIGDQGLKVDDSRLIVELSNNSGVGDKAPTLVVGPLDQATPEAADALLKTLEDLTEAPLRIVLWADHLSEVIPTIRSRTRPEWCPAGPTYLHPLSHLEDKAKELCLAVLSRDPVRILGSLEEVGKDWLELLQALTMELPNHLEGENHAVLLGVWERLRPVLDGKGSLLVAADALLPVDLN